MIETLGGSPLGEGCALVPFLFCQFCRVLVSSWECRGSHDLVIKRGFYAENGAEHSKVISIQSSRNRGGESEGVSCIQDDGLENLGIDLKFPVIWNSGVEEQRFQEFVDACRF